MTTISELAKRLGFVTFPSALDAAKLPAAASGAPSLPGKLAGGDALVHLPRLGLHPALVTSLRAWLAQRPLERGLLAWDVLNGAALSLVDDVELILALRQDAAAVREVLPPAGAVGARCRKATSAALLARLATPGFAEASDDALVHAVAHERALGALAQLAARHGAKLTPEVLDGVRQFARTLHLCHLPTLASFYLWSLWHDFGVTRAAGDYAEVMLDVAALGGLPSPAELEALPDAAELAGYQTYRRAAIDGQTAAMFKDCVTRFAQFPLDKIAPGQIGVMARSIACYAELGWTQKQFPVPIDLMAQVVARDETWRYAQRVLVVMASGAAAAAGDEAAEAVLGLVDRYLAAFGNDFQLWDGVLHAAPAGGRLRRELTARLVREVTALPHDVLAWSALAVAIDADDAAFAEVGALRVALAKLP